MTDRPAMNLRVAALLVLIVGCPRAAPAPAPPGPNDFDRKAALATLQEAEARSRRCAREGGPRGDYRIAVTFATEGHVTRAYVEGRLTDGRRLDPTFERVASDGEVRSCVERAFREAQMPPFQGPPVTVHKTFLLDPGALDRETPRESR